MELLKLSEIIGHEIAEVRFRFTPDNDDDDDDYLQTALDDGSSISESEKNIIIGQKIVGFFFRYYNNESDNDHSAYIKLSNGYYITQRSHALAI